MFGWWFWVLLVAAGALILDRLLLIAEAKGWINYRRKGLSRGAAAYHAVELATIFNPSMEPVMEVRYAEERDQDDSGAPPAPDGDATPEPPVPGSEDLRTHDDP